VVPRSGSDWSHHCIYRGLATFSGGGLVEDEMERRRQTFVHEHDEKSYCREAAVRDVVAELTSELRGPAHVSAGAASQAGTSAPAARTARARSSSSSRS
jgi:hypothetical protein